MLFLPTIFTSLVVATCVGADGATGGSALYPPGLLPLITRANALLSTGQFNDAIRAYSEALGKLFSEVVHPGVLYLRCPLTMSQRSQNSHPLTTSSITNVQRRISLLADIKMHSRTSTKFSTLPDTRSTKHCS